MDTSGTWATAHTYQRDDLTSTYVAFKTSEMILVLVFIESCNKKYLFVTGKVEENGQYSYRIATFDWTRPWVTTPGDRWGAWVNQSPTVIPIDSVLRRFCLT